MSNKSIIFVFFDFFRSRIFSNKQKKHWPRPNAPISADKKYTPHIMPLISADERPRGGESESADVLRAGSPVQGYDLLLDRGYPRSIRGATRQPAAKIRHPALCVSRIRGTVPSDSCQTRLVEWSMNSPWCFSWLDFFTPGHEMQKLFAPKPQPLWTKPFKIPSYLTIISLLWTNCWN